MKQRRRGKGKIHHRCILQMLTTLNIRNMSSFLELYLMKVATFAILLAFIYSLSITSKMST
jgi:hypothetical protein